MEPITELKKDKRKLILVIVVITLFSGFIIYMISRAMTEEERKSKLRMEEMEQKMADLENNIASMQKYSRRVKKERDSLKRKVDYVWPLRSIVFNAKLRDQVGDASDLKPGDMAWLKMDSSKVLVTEIIVGGNEFTYYVHYLVRNKKGESVQVSPHEIKKIDN